MEAGRGAKDEEHTMALRLNSVIRQPYRYSKNSFHIVGRDVRGAFVLRQKWSRGQVANFHCVLI